ncbi:MAG: hypothetical protein IH828_08815 [Nitrospinae bacterium]|nr:hypothetical protein [Nitrospinota bacterium]
MFSAFRRAQAPFGGPLAAVSAILAVAVLSAGPQRAGGTSLPALAVKVTTYPGSDWKTAQGGVEEINAYCSEALGNPGEGAKWLGCILPERKVIASSDWENCLHEAVHAADEEWGNTPGHRLLFRPLPGQPTPPEAGLRRGLAPQLTAPP